jgi:CubicO group peptidase (beta-lactamase class C family)
VPNRIDTQFGIASGTKGLTALTVVSLFESGALTPATRARSLLWQDLPLIDDAVTVEQLLAHRSGIGDYLDEESGANPTDYVLAIPVHELTTSEAYLPLLDRRPAKFKPDERFSYCNSGYVVLALIAERATGIAFHDLVAQRVCQPAGMRDTAFLRSDELPGRAAIGYLGEGMRTNLLHLPARGSGDGGVYSTAADVHRLWDAFLGGRIVSTRWVEQMLRPRSDAREPSRRYGLGFWLDSTGAVMLEGSDAGVSFRSVCDPGGLTWTVLSNTTRGAWPVVRELSRYCDARRSSR